MRRSSHVHLTLLPWLATAAFAHLQTGCTPDWDTAAADPSGGALGSPECGPDEVQVDPSNCPASVDDGFDRVCCAEEAPVAANVTVGDAHAYGARILTPAPRIYIRRGGFGGYFRSAGG